MSPFRLDSTNSVNAFLDRIGGTPVKLTPPHSVEERVMPVEKSTKRTEILSCLDQRLTMKMER